jgi:hypothetical protein
VAAYGQRLERLTALKDRHDPTNFFRQNANIPPSGQRDAFGNDLPASSTAATRHAMPIVA